MRPLLLFITSLALSYAVSSDADQYRSRELKTSSMGKQVEKSIEQLEAELGSIADSYSKASTARYLARHYSSEKNYNKAAGYYREALKGEGLSDFAKQDILAELAQVYLLLNNHAAVIQTLEQRKQLGGKESSILLMMQAMAHLHLKNNSAAIACADAAWASEPRPSPNLLKQLLYVYFQTGSYQNAARTQQAYLQLEANDLAGWRQLAAIYMKMQLSSKAADALAVARENGLALTAEDITLLADLYNKVNNPFAAARLYDASIANRQLPETLENLDRLFYYWMQARERGKAIATLQRALAQKPDIERYLYLAQLQMDEQQWQPMKQSVINACNIALPDEFVSRANLLLGISELKLGNPGAARRAFINATLIGGEGETAAQYLRYMEAESVSDEEADNFDGPCTPKWARTEARQLALAVKENLTAAPEAVKYQVKTSKPQTLIYGNYTLGVDELEKRLLPLVMKLGTYIVKNGGRISGNLHFLFPKPIEPGTKILQFQMAFPVSQKPQLLGRYRVLEDPGFKAANTTFVGTPEALPGYWLKLYETATGDGLTFSGASRQVVLDAQNSSKERIKMELQLGVE